MRLGLGILGLRQTRVGTRARVSMYFLQRDVEEMGVAFRK